MRTAARTDNNHREIVEGLRQAHRSVLDLSGVHKGCPDILVGFQGINYLLEIKSSKKAKLTPAQVEFHSAWRGQRLVVISLEEAIEATSKNRPTRFSYKGDTANAASRDNDQLLSVEPIKKAGA